MVLIRTKVLPGDLLHDSYQGQPPPHTYKLGNKLISLKVGLVEIEGKEVKLIPLAGPYIPRVNDFVIGKIIDFDAFSWDVDINSIYTAHLPAQDVFGRDFSPQTHSLTSQFKVGDILAAKIISYDRTKDPVLTVRDHGLGKIVNGEPVKLSPSKIPRLIGKKGSMAKIIESKTKTKLIIGQNGVIIVQGPSEGIVLAAKAIRLIEEKAHLPSLTNMINELLTREGG
ncbi:MAG: exosome complex RNA-binding protein Rrp4 [Nitrososphaeria archaeon]